MGRTKIGGFQAQCCCHCATISKEKCMSTEGISHINPTRSVLPFKLVWLYSLIPALEVRVRMGLRMEDRRPRGGRGGAWVSSEGDLEIKDGREGDGGEGHNRAEGDKCWGGGGGPVAGGNGGRGGRYPAGL